VTAPTPVAVVTGGAGFIGSHMVDLLVTNGYRVRVLDNLTGGRAANIGHHDGTVTLDERDIRSLAPNDTLFAGVSHLFHFAGIGDIVPSIEHPLDYMSVNVQGTVQMLEAARFAEVKKFVYAASSSCYGMAAVPTAETHPIAPQYPYALSKHLGEQAVLHWHRVYRLPVNSVRIFNAYGPRSRTSGAYGAVFGVFLKQKLAGQPFTVVGDGTQRRDFLYASDVASAFAAAAETPLVGRIWNIGAGQPQSILRLVDLLGGPVVFIPRRPGEPECTWANISRIREDLAWAPQVSFEQGVAEVVSKIDYWKDAPLWTPDSIAAATRPWFRALGDQDGSSGNVPK